MLVGKHPKFVEEIRQDRIRKQTSAVSGNVRKRACVYSYSKQTFKGNEFYVGITTAFTPPFSHL